MSAIVLIDSTIPDYQSLTIDLETRIELVTLDSAIVPVPPGAIALSNPYTQNFDTLISSGSATWIDNSSIAGWYTARTGTGTTIVASDGSSNAGNLYSFSSTTGDIDRALGSIGSGNAAAGGFFWGVRFFNDTGNVINQLNISYAGEQWRNSAATDQTLDFQYQIAAPSLTGGTWIDANNLDFTSLINGGTVGALNGNLTSNRSLISGTISGLALNPGQELWLRWVDIDHTGSDHGLAIDDVQVSTSPLPGVTITESGSSTNIADNDFSVVITKIHDIQGIGATFNSVFSGVRTVEGIVVGAFLDSRNLNGFFVQEEDSDADSDTNTSEGIFVYDPSRLFSGVIGTKVQVTGMVNEFTSTGSGVNSSLTQLANIATVFSFGVSTLPTAINLQFPVNSVGDLERYEGMLVNVSAASGDLTVTEHFQLGRFGQVVLAAMGASNQPDTDARLDQYTQFNAPSVDGYTAYLADISKREIILDDGRTTQNPDPILFARGGNPLSATNTLRGGDTISNITGILDERFEGYRIQTSGVVNFTPANPRPTTPVDIDGSLKIGSFNVLNYFNGDGLGGGFPTARGAENQAEFTRQRNKIIQAIVNSGADVMGLMEIENDGYGSTSAIQDLVNGLNAVAGAGTYTFINPGASLGTDQIVVGLIYKPDKVTPVGTAATMSTGYGQGVFDLVGRKPLAQTFQQNSNGEEFTLVVNHFKSKGSSSGGVGDADAGDGQGLSNGTRTRQAQDLAAWLATNPTGSNDSDYLIIGDLNAYPQEDPLTTLGNAGYSNLLPTSSYSYVFDGQWGSLDHALASSSLATQISGAIKWHINADEPNVLDYNTNFKSANQITSLYNPDQFRASDHDPVLIGLNLKSRVNNPATITGDGTAVVTEDSGVIDGKLAATGILTVTDIDQGENKFNTTVTSDLGNLGVLTISETGSFSYSVDNSAVQNLGASQSKTETFTVESFDGTASQDILITINGINDAPVLDANTPKLIPINQIETNNNGQTVASFLGNSISDVDTIANQGIAVVRLTSTTGNWQYNTGSGWFNIAPVSNRNALLLRNNDLIRFVATGTNFTNPTLTYRAWDQTSGELGTKINIRDTGGTSAFSTTMNTVSIAVGTIQIGDIRADTLIGNDGPDYLDGGKGNDTLVGGDGNDTLLGGNGNDVLVGGLGSDQLTGGGGNDTFRYDSLGESLLSGFDRITELQIGSDRINAPYAVSAVNIAKLGTVASLTELSISTVLTTKNFRAFGAATFTFGTASNARTFLALNDGMAGFSTTNDSVIEITGYSGNLSNLAIL